MDNIHLEEDNEEDVPKRSIWTPEFDVSKMQPVADGRQDQTATDQSIPADTE